MIEDTGLGYYQMPYPIYTFMIAIAYTEFLHCIKIISEKLVHKNMVKHIRYFNIHLLYYFSQEYLHPYFYF